MSIEKTKVDGLCPHIMGAGRIYLYEVVTAKKFSLVVYG